MAQANIEYCYDFILEPGNPVRFRIELDPVYFRLINTTADIRPFWTELSYKKCRCCTLPEDRFTHCPIASNIVDVVDFFKDIVAHGQCTVRCTTRQRIYEKETNVREGLSSVLGIIMATSACPVMDFLRPMARFHLPFSTLEETMVRAVSMFLLREYFEYKEKRIDKIDLERLEHNYSLVQQVNEGLMDRIRSLGQKDADKNAIVTLHSISFFLSSELDYSLDSLARFFNYEKVSV